MSLGSDTTPLRQELEAALPDRPFGVRFWDGSELPATAAGGPLLTARSPRGVAHALLAPGQLGLSRAYVSGELEVNDLDALIARMRDWQPPPIDAATKRRLLLGAARAVGIMRPPRRPSVELRPRGKRHSVARDRRAVRHHYDVSNEFFALFLDDSMTYSCAIFEDPLSEDESLESARSASSRRSARSSRCGPASVCSTSVAAGAASRSMRRPSTARMWSQSRCQSRRHGSRASARRLPASKTASRSAWPTIAS